MNKEEAEKEYLHRRAHKNYVKGLLVEIVTIDTSVDQLAENIIEQYEVMKDSTDDELQKILLGEIAGCIEHDFPGGVSKTPQAVAVSIKIIEHLRK